MTAQKPLYISYAGPTLLETPLLNKGTAFTESERRTFNLIGLLPPRYETIEEQVERAYMQYCSFDEAINKHIYLRAVQDTNETLFYRLVREHLVEMLPIIYTPTIGDACEHFSWPGVLIQFEDFAQPNAMPILQRHRDRVCCFNDDIQGTAAVTLGTLLAACRKKNERLRDQKIVVVGAGSAGCGIAELIINAMVGQGLDDAQARARLFMVDRFGLLTEGMEKLMDFQTRLLQPRAALGNWVWEDSNQAASNLFNVVMNVKPGVLIGVSGKAGLFTEAVIRQMHSTCHQPVIFPLSNPSRHVEAHPQQVIEWTNGQAIVATGSPFGKVMHDGREYEIAQCNNSYIFPGIGLGVIACKSARVTDEMLMAASITLSENAPQTINQTSSVLPPLTALQQISRRIAVAVAKIAMRQGHAREMTDEQLYESIDRNYWTPAYREYRRIATRAN